MKRLLIGWGTTLLLLTAASSARAEQVDWSFSWSSSPSVIDASSGGANGIKLFAGPAGTFVGTNPANLTAATFEAFGSLPASYTDAGYSVTLFLKDEPSGESGSLTFTGLLNGKFSSEGVELTNTITSLSSQALALGGRNYEVGMDVFIPPGLPGLPDPPGELRANVMVSGSPINEVPEPASALLAVLGAAALGLKCYRTRRWRARAHA